MTRFLGAAGLAVYVLAVSTAFPSVREAAASLSFFAPAMAAEAGAADASATTAAEAPAASARAPVVAAGSTWHADRDGMLMQDAPAAEPFSVLN